MGYARPGCSFVLKKRFEYRWQISETIAQKREGILLREYELISLQAVIAIRSAIKTQMVLQYRSNTVICREVMKMYM